MYPRYKYLHNIATEGAMFVTRQTVREMCIAVADNQSTGHTPKIEPIGHSSIQSMLCLVYPSLQLLSKQPPAEHALAMATQPQHAQVKKIKLDETAYDDWLSDVIYVGTSKAPKQITASELVNKELEKYDAEPQITGDPLLWWRSREGTMPILAQVARAILCVPGSSVPS